MTRWFAFLRGINLGGHIVKMDALRGHFEALGFTNVETFIASGNVIFEAELADGPALEERIGSALGAALGFAAPAYLRNTADLKAIAAECPFSADERAAALSLYVIMSARPLSDSARERVQRLSSELDTLRTRGREVYWLCRGRMSESPVFGKGLLDKALGEPATSRNMNTIDRLIAKYCR